MRSLEDLLSLKADLTRELDAARNLRETVSRDLRLGRADANAMAVVSADVEARELELEDIARRIAIERSEAGQARRAKYHARIRKMHRSIVDQGQAAVEAAKFAEAHLGLAAHHVAVAVQSMKAVASAGGALLGTVRPERLFNDVDPALANAGAAVTQALAVRIDALVKAVPGLAQYVTVGMFQHGPGAASMVDTVARAVHATDRRMAEYASSAGIDVLAEEDELV